MSITPQQIQQVKSRFGIVGHSPLLTEAVSRALRVAPIDLSVLITGESGSGKEFFPQIIHAYSPRKHAKYIAVNCGAIPEGTLDSELFGHEKGSFTGAVSTRKGYFEEADGGTIFLDEVAELPLTTQARLLRVLESGEFLKVGSSVVQKTNIRVVAATNVDMEKAVKEGRFREDLFYRLSTVEIHVPPLRERADDIMLLSMKFAQDFAERYRVPGITFSAEARSLMLHYRWPGNVRQLKNLVEQLALFEAGSEILEATLLQYLPQAKMSYAPAIAKDHSASLHTYEHEREILFSMIFRMQNELQHMREALDEMKRSGAAAATVVHHGGEHAPVTTELALAKLHHLDAGSPLSPSSVTAAHAAPIDKYDEAEEISITDVTDSVDATDDDVAAGDAVPPTLLETEKEMIRQSLLRNGGHRKQVADELKISERTLYRKLKRYGLDSI